MGFVMLDLQEQVNGYSYQIRCRSAQVPRDLVGSLLKLLTLQRFAWWVATLPVTAAASVQAARNRETFRKIE